MEAVCDFEQGGEDGVSVDAGAEMEGGKGHHTKRKKIHTIASNLMILSNLTPK